MGYAHGCFEILFLESRTGRETPLLLIVSHFRLVPRISNVTPGPRVVPLAAVCLERTTGRVLNKIK